MKVPCSTRDKIIRMGKGRWKVWRIAQDTGLSVDDVLEVLVDAGVVPETMVELVRKAGTK